MNHNRNALDDCRKRESAKSADSVSTGNLDKAYRRAATCLCALLLALLAAHPLSAFASEGFRAGAVYESETDAGLVTELIAQAQARIEEVQLEIAQIEAAQASEEEESVCKLLSYDRALIDRIGTQERTGHTICCPSFSCAYADAVMDGTVHDHSYYTCSRCTWTDWGGGDSSFRRVGDDGQLLREAYDQIKAGRPTVIHVRASYGEHWIALIGYEDAVEPDHLSLSNFIALDPWDGSQVNAGASFSLYGDGCEHISER